MFIIKIMWNIWWEKSFRIFRWRQWLKKNHLIRKVPDQGLIKSSFLVTLIVNNVQYRVSNVQFSVDSNQDATENDSTEPGSGQGDRETMIRRVLEQTSEAICEIDGLLTTLKCSSWRKCLLSKIKNKFWCLNCWIFS